MREKGDDLDQHSIQARKSEKIRRASNVKIFLEEKEEDPLFKRVKHVDRLVLPLHLATKLGAHEGLVCAWLRLSQKVNKSCTEKYIEENSER